MSKEKMNQPLIAKNIVYLCKKNKLPQRQLGLRLGYPEDSAGQQVNKWTKGGRIPSMDKLISICEVFEISLSALLTVDLENFDSVDLKSEYVEGNEELQKRNREYDAYWQYLKALGVRKEVDYKISNSRSEPIINEDGEHEGFCISEEIELSRYTTLSFKDSDGCDCVVSVLTNKLDTFINDMRKRNFFEFELFVFNNEELNED